MANTSRAEIRTAIHQRIRRKVKGDTERPRLAIYRSLNHIYAQAIAERAIAKGIESVVFDRGGYLYHGRVKALTDAARAAGLNKNEVVAEPEPEAAPPVEEQPTEKKSKKKKKE